MSQNAPPSLNSCCMCGLVGASFSRTLPNVGTRAPLTLRSPGRSQPTAADFPGPVRHPCECRVVVADHVIVGGGQKSVSKPSAPARSAALKAPRVFSERAAPYRVRVPVRLRGDR